MLRRNGDGLSSWQGATGPRCRSASTVRGVSAPRPRTNTQPSNRAQQSSEQTTQQQTDTQANVTGHICTGTWLIPATSAPGLGTSSPHLHQDSARPLPHLHRDCCAPAAMARPADGVGAAGLGGGAGSGIPAYSGARGEGSGLAAPAPGLGAAGLGADRSFFPQSLAAGNGGAPRCHAG